MLFVADSARLLRALAWQAGSLAAATILVAVLTFWLGVQNASAIYLLAVAMVAIRYGSLAAAGTAFASFVLFNFFFVEPRYTFVVATLDSLITLLMLLGLGILIGQLAGAQHDRAEVAARREQEARSLALVARTLASARRVRDALSQVLPELASSARLEAAWVGLGSNPTQEQIAWLHDPAGLTGGRPAGFETSGFATLHPQGVDRPARWVRLNTPTPAQRPVRRGPAGDAVALHRIEMRDDAGEFGSLWFLRKEALGRPSEEETRMLQAAAEQIAQGIRRDRLADQAMELEVAIRSDELKTALLDSVSHDLRTPLASIRAAAGNLADPDLGWDAEAQRAAALDIDREAERLSHLVSGLLDMSRIRSGALQPQPEVIPADDLIRGVITRSSELIGDRPLQIDVPLDEPLLWVDPVFADQVVSNLVENAVLHTASTAAIRVSARPANDGRVQVVVEDGGAGLTDDQMQRIFEPFTRGRGSGSRPAGAGLGLSIVRGLVEAMGGRVTARASELGGLAIQLELPAAQPAEG